MRSWEDDDDRHRCLLLRPITRSVRSINSGCGMCVETGIILRLNWILNDDHSLLPHGSTSYRTSSYKYTTILSIPIAAETVSKNPECAHHHLTIADIF